MATLSSIASDVYVLTNRPDLEQETKVAIRKAIVKFHAADTFKRDLTTQRLQMSQYTPLAPNQFRWAIPLSEFTRFRRPKSLQYPLDLMFPHNQIPAPLYDGIPIYARKDAFRELHPDNLFDTYNYEHQNYFYIAGSTLTIRASVDVDYLDFMYYQWPFVPALSADTDPIQSWICDEYVDAVIEESAGAVFKMIGKDDEFSRYQALFMENITILRGVDIGENN